MRRASDCASDVGGGNCLRTGSPIAGSRSRLERLAPGVVRGSGGAHSSMLRCCIISPSISCSSQSPTILPFSKRPILICETFVLSPVGELRKSCPKVFQVNSLLQEQLSSRRRFVFSKTWHSGSSFLPEDLKSPCMKVYMNHRHIPYPQHRLRQFDQESK